MGTSADTRCRTFPRDHARLARRRAVRQTGHRIPARIRCWTSLSASWTPLQIPQATLVGNSMGAGLAIGMALAHPTRVSKLDPHRRAAATRHGETDQSVSQTGLETSAPSWLVSFGNWLFGGLMIESDLKRNRARPGTAHTGRHRTIQSQPSTAWTDYTQMTVRENLPLWEAGFATRIGEITHPTLILWGEEDRVFPIAVGEEFQRTIKGSSFVRIPQGGHIPQWERPDLVNQAMIEFLGRH